MVNTVAMSSEVRFGLIGCGGFMRHHVSLLNKVPGAKVAALNDTDPVQIERTHAAYPETKSLPVYSDYRELLAAGGVDAVIISTPHTMHTQQVIDSLAASLHVLVDKPMVTSVADAKKVIAARDASGKVTGVSYQRHGAGTFRWLKHVTESGEFGKIRMVTSHLGQQWLQFTRGSWRQSMALSGGGQLNDSGSHMVDVLLWFTGLKAKHVSAFIDFCGTEVDINSVVNVVFETGQMASLSIIGDAACWHERHNIWFEDALVTLSDDTVRVMRRDGMFFTVDNWPGAETPEQNFVDAIQGKGQVLAPFECGLRTIELTEAAWRSHEQGGAPVDVGSLG